jgi:mRNA interferase RelE/StbE
MKEYRIRFTPEAALSVSRLYPDHKKIIREAFEELKQAPSSGDDLQGDLSGFKSFKPKRFRIIYKVDDETRFINVFHIGHRRDVYDQFRIILDKLKP